MASHVGAAPEASPVCAKVSSCSAARVGATEDTPGSTASRAPPPDDGSTAAAAVGIAPPPSAGTAWTMNGIWEITGKTVHAAAVAPHGPHNRGPLHRWTQNYTPPAGVALCTPVTVSESCDAVSMFLTSAPLPPTHGRSDWAAQRAPASTDRAGYASCRCFNDESLRLTRHMVPIPLVCQPTRPRRPRVYAVSRAATQYQARRMLLLIFLPSLASRWTSSTLLVLLTACFAVAAARCAPQSPPRTARMAAASRARASRRAGRL
jgi:hypothetical protein